MDQHPIQEERRVKKGLTLGSLNVQNEMSRCDAMKTILLKRKFPIKYFGIINSWLLLNSHRNRPKTLLILSASPVERCTASISSSSPALGAVHYRTGTGLNRLA